MANLCFGSICHVTTFKSSPRFRNVKLAKSFLEFVEPDEHNEINSLVLDVENDEYERLSNLIKGAWQMIQSINLPSISKYPQTLEGIIAFENDIIESLNELNKDIKTVIGAVVSGESLEGNDAIKNLMQFNPKTIDKMRRFYKKVGVAVAVPIMLLVMGLILLEPVVLQ